MKLSIVPLLALAAAAAPDSLAAAESRVACILTGAEGPAGGLAVMRDGQRLQPLAYLSLREGDELIVDAPDARLVARCGAGEVSVTRGTSPHRVRFDGNPTTVADNLRAWLVDFLSGVDVAAEPPGKTSVVVRGDEEARLLDIPLLTTRSAMVGAGRRELAVGWWGGRGPFRVRLYDPDRRLMLAEASGVTARSTVVSFDDALAPGSYSVEIVDASGRYARGDLEAVEPAAIPRIPKALRDAAAEGAIGATVNSAWIASANGGVFALEAYQDLARLASTHQPAAMLQRELRFGSVPPPPPPDSDG
jgi:hypothetical protein